MQLAEDEVHLWRIRTDEQCDLQALGEVLSAEERAKAERYRFERDRRRSIVRRASLRQIIAGYVGVSPAELSFRYGPQGKPALDAPFCESQIAFNLSFSGELAVCAVARQPLGVDLERYRQVENASLVARHFFTPAEISLQNEAEDADRVFLRHWTRKEALIKATGSGLSVPLDSCDVSWRPDEAAHQVSLPDADGRLTTWFLRDLSLGPEWFAALAIASPNSEIRWRS